MKNALSLAGWPPFSSATCNSMFEQLECHLLWRVKTPYDLGSWRPSVSWATEVYDECNPGYPHATLWLGDESILTSKRPAGSLRRGV